MSVSHWQLRDTTTETCDALVIGGGIAGIAVARTLADRGCSFRVLERHRVAWGASGRNAGFLMRGAADNYAVAVREWGRDRAKALWTFTEENLALLRSWGIESLPNYRRIPSCLLGLTERESEELRESRRLMSEDGFAVGDRAALEPDSILSRAGERVEALVNPDDGACHSVEVLEFLSRPVRDFIREGAEVARIEAMGSGARVTSSAGVFEADRVFVCANAWADRVLQVAGHRRSPAVVAPKRGQMFAAEGDGLTFSASYYMNRGSEYVRLAADGTLLVGGCRTTHAEEEVGYDDHVTERVQTALERFAEVILGEPPRVKHRWAGIMGFGPGGLPVVDTIGERLGFDRDDRVTLCAGFTGHGMSMAARASQLAVARSLDRSETLFPLA
ncbi:MAG: FAD-binding oxidoreductase [Planctomycetota bacterium]